MYKDRDLKIYFKDLFSRKDIVKQRKRKIKRSFVKIKQRLTSVFLWILLHELVNSPNASIISLLIPLNLPTSSVKFI